jgi:hypothetical protein
VTGSAVCVEEEAGISIILQRTGVLTAVGSRSVEEEIQWALGLSRMTAKEAPDEKNEFPSLRLFGCPSRERCRSASGFLGEWLKRVM